VVPIVWADRLLITIELGRLQARSQGLRKDTFVMARLNERQLRGMVRLAPSSHGKVQTTIPRPAVVAGQLSAAPTALSATFLSTKVTIQGLSPNAPDSFGSPPEGSEDRDQRSQ